MTYTLPARAYVQLRTTFASPRPYDWTLVSAGETMEQAKERALEWVREVNRHQKNPSVYWIHVTLESEGKHVTEASDD